MFNIVDVLEKLSEERPVFHSEADFQHSLAWKIHEIYPDFNVRLEKREEINGEELYLDIFIPGNDKVYALELKYKTKKLDITIPNPNEDFHLKNQSAQAISRYDFCKDIERLEKVSRKYPNGTGFAIFLTNDDLYWKITRNRDTVDLNFRIYEGKTIKGTLKWREETAKGTMKGRENPVKLTGKYSVRWKEYSNLKNGEFKYLLIKVKHGNSV